MLKYFIRKVQPHRFFHFRPTIVIAIPSGITQVEKRAVIDSAEHAGARNVILIEEPKKTFVTLAAAIIASVLPKTLFQRLEYNINRR